MFNLPRTFVTALIGPLGLLAMAVAALATPGRPPQKPDPPPHLALYVSRFLDVANSTGEAGKTGHAFPAMEKLLGLPSAAGILTAFEENRFFVYGEVRIKDSATGSSWNRRIIFFKPSIFIVDDAELSRAEPQPAAWHIYSSASPLTRGGKARIQLERGEIAIETLIPEKISRSAQACSGRECAQGGERFLLQIAPQAKAEIDRFLHVLDFSAGRGLSTQTHSKLVKVDSRTQLTVTSGQRIFRWSMPSKGDDPGEVAVMTAGAMQLVSTRPLPSGVLPHSPQGIRLLEVWDGDYRDGRHPRWDTGQPSGDLKKAIDDGVIPPGRVVEFGCGTGSDAIYMASRGFDVTAIDISPSAIAQALEKARKARVRVRFMLADALNPPAIGEFDFIYDRACYHEVRGQNLEAYLETLRKASRPGTRMLLLAGNSNGPNLGFGPPTVTEEELRFDFLPLFDIEWLRESRFEVNPPTAGFPLAWSALMRRKAD